MKRKLSNKFLLQSLLDTAKKLGRTPEKKGLKYYNAIKKRFGSLTNTNKKLNLPPLRKLN